MADTQLEKVKLTAKSIKSSLVDSTKKLKRVKLNNQRFLGKELDKKKKQEEETRLERKGPIKSTLSKVASKIVSGPMDIWNKILQFGSFMLAGIIVQYLPKIIDIIGSMFNLVSSVLTPIMNGVIGLIDFIGVAPIDKRKSDEEKAELDSLNQEGRQLAKNLEEFESTLSKEVSEMEMNTPTSEEKNMDKDIKDGDNKAIEENKIRLQQEQNASRSVKKLQNEEKQKPQGFMRGLAGFGDLLTGNRWDLDKRGPNNKQEVPKGIEYERDGVPLPPSLMMLDSSAIGSWPAIVAAAKKDGVDLNSAVKIFEKPSSGGILGGSVNPFKKEIQFKMDSPSYMWMLKNASKFNWKQIKSQPNVFKYIGPSNKTSSISPVNKSQSLNSAKGPSSDGTIIFAVQPVMQPFPVHRIVRVSSSKKVVSSSKRNLSSIWRA
tara:strand:- start:1243 stop:2538 length:1296 start_codon:yes stop_codon:yes gene_type:complete